MGNKCGGPLTEDCLGDSDPRYDDDASNNLEDQSNLWTLQKGFFKGVRYQYGPDYQPELTTPEGYGSFPRTEFMNFSVVGTRFYKHTYTFSANLTDSNATGDLQLRDYLGHSTFEKDGTAEIPLAQSYYFDSGFANSVRVQESKYFPVGNSTLFSSQFVGDWTVLDSWTCLDKECNKASIFADLYIGSNRLRISAGTFTRVESEQEWIEQLQAEYENFNIPDAWSPVPMQTDCLVAQEGCLSDEDFCASGDPSCSESPYNEPDAKVKPGVIAGFTIAGVVIAAALVLVVIHSLLQRQARRNRIKFAQCVADDMSIKKSARSLTPELLEKEFNKIDNEHGGQISREAMWEFLNSGKAGEINERDFRALWNVLDADKTGSVDFLEFCAFLAKCHDEYNAAARANRSSIAVASSLARVSVARSVSLKMAESSANVQEEEEGGGQQPKTEET